MGDRRSADVCALFPELPITYRFREPALTYPEHVCALLKEAEGELTAFVCDDDLWAPGHIETAIASLDANPEAVAHFSAFVMAESELARPASLWAAPLVWLAAGRPPRMSEYVMTTESVYALGWMVAPFQFSTLVGRTPVVNAAADAFVTASHPYYADRLFCLAIADHGPVVFDPAVDTLYRSINGQGEGVRRADPRRVARTPSGLRRGGIGTARSRGWDVAELWRSYLADLPEEIADVVGTEFAERFTSEEMQAFGFADLSPGLRRTFIDRVAGRLTKAWKALIGAPI